ncbi:hypothetical protein ACFYWS_20445 [Streptomyces sp. NPDC002795]|uniref:hypothetical protein n=1 Tax=Streptomyces sp. NPDC002795 TaxID=3364665 RepID=UPI0036B1D24D
MRDEGPISDRELHDALSRWESIVEAEAKVIDDLIDEPPSGAPLPEGPMGEQVALGRLLKEVLGPSPVTSEEIQARDPARIERTREAMLQEVRRLQAEREQDVDGQAAS